MINSVASGIDTALCELETATTVLDAALERAGRSETVKAENPHDYIWQQEIHYLHELMMATYVLLQEPVSSLEDIKGTAYQLAKEAKNHDSV